MMRALRYFMIKGLLKSFLRFLNAAFASILAVLILFEEWGWEPLQRLLEKVGRLPLIHQIEAAILCLSPRVSLLLFLLPSFFLLPIKILALGLIAHGKPTLGIVVIVLAKIIGTAVVARLFTLTRPALLKMPWFELLYLRWTNWKDSLLTRVRCSWAWRKAGDLKRLVRLYWTIRKRG